MEPLSERRRAVVLAGYSGDISLVRSALVDPEPQVRSAALGALERLDAVESADLSVGFSDPDPLVRSRTARIAARSTVYSPELLALLGDDDSTVVEVAAFAIGECFDTPPEAIQGLIQSVKDHDDSLCREAATAALGSLGHPEGLDAILHACSDKATVRRRAVLALAAFEGEQVTEMLKHLSSDRDLQVRQSAEELLAIEEGEPL